MSDKIVIYLFNLFPFLAKDNMLRKNERFGINKNVQVCPIHIDLLLEKCGSRIFRIDFMSWGAKHCHRTSCLMLRIMGSGAPRLPPARDPLVDSRPEVRLLRQVHVNGQ
jgi:hypothetical protein